ncbi:hypothetical protein [Desulfoluna sp.]|uniref:hypothetical protein n=1 Tax=Desulfoluna sp. TaxID=2045199 RepID=UPI0026292529|nr:hypothetical protein [Desulfoluna sp.]
MLKIRILDLDYHRLIKSEQTLLRALKYNGLYGRVMMVAEPLELSRFNVLECMPALEINDAIVSRGRVIDDEMARWILATVAERISATRSASEEGVSRKSIL